ncbi:MAG: hypothetical protein OEY36_07910 [Gammaproteobacteria bacterium]|nr:hypothetical protein [Gammaproteobacteria bacterium]
MQITNKFRYSSLMLLLMTGLAGCGGSSSSPAGNQDSDGDGLTNSDEINLYYTNPDVADTDGDGYSDYEEIINKNFNSANNNYSFNPLIADVPKLNVSIGVPNFSVNYTTADGTSNSQSTGYDNAVSNETSSTTGGSDSHSIARSFSAEVSIEAEVSSIPSVKVGLKLTSGFTDTNANESNWSQTSGTSSTQSYSTLQATSTDSSISIDSAQMNLYVSVDNPGNVAYTLNDLSLSVIMAGNNASGYGIPIGTLSRAVGNSIPMAVGAAASGNIYSMDMNLDNYKTLISNYKDLVITPIVGENNLGSDNSETNWVNLSDDVTARTATISIDYGTARPTETYRVATASAPGSQNITLRQVMVDILKIPYAVITEDLIVAGDITPTTSTSFENIREVTANRLTNQSWLVAHEHTINGGIDTITEIYTPNVIQDIENLSIIAGDKLRLVYVKDSDSDNLSDREEFMLGTDPLTVDSDGDGISDGNEFYGYLTADPAAINPAFLITSNPALADSDGDGLNDYDEWQVYYTDPTNADTDGDGASDSYEVTLMLSCGTCNGPAVSDGTYFATDSDGDGLVDVEEEFTLLTNKNLADTDGDGLSDSFELARVSDILIDTAGLTLDLRGCVTAYNERITALNNSAYDVYKLSAGSASKCDPLLADTDADGVNDGAELTGWTAGFPTGSTVLIPSNPFVKDTDGDGLQDNDEKVKSGNALAVDTDLDGMNDGAEIASIHSRSVTIPEVIAEASISQIQATQCWGAYSGLFGFSESQVAFNKYLMPQSTSLTNVDWYARIDGTLGAKDYWSNLLMRIKPDGESNPANWTINANAGYTNGYDSSGNWMGGTGVEFVTDGSLYWDPLAIPAGSVYNSDYFSMATNSLDSQNTISDMHSQIWMIKEQVYHPQHVKIAQGQTLKVWSGHFCKTPNANINHLRIGGVWDDNPANPQDCTSTYTTPANALTKTWTYAKLKAGLSAADKEETTTLKSGIDPGCSLKVIYDINTIQE